MNQQMKRGRKQTTGRFESRRLLEEKVMFLRNYTTCAVPDIARNVQVSEATVTDIINKNCYWHNK